MPELKESAAAKNEFEPIRCHKDCGQSLYFFGRSGKFRTVKYPFAWYSALRLADVLTRFQFLRGDPLVRELMDRIGRSRDGRGTYRPTSMNGP